MCAVVLAASLWLSARRPSGLSPDEALFLSLEKAWNLAEEHKDVHALDQLLPSTLVFTDFDGFMRA
jgi:hypothetical protein